MKLLSVWSSHIQNLLKISRKNALSWIRLGIVWGNVLTSARRSLEILTTCSVSSVTSGTDAIPPLNWFIISEAYMAYFCTGIFLWRVFRKGLFSLFWIISVVGGENSLLLCVHRDLMSWINGIRGLVSSDELAKDVTGAEALLERHQVCKR